MQAADIHYPGQWNAHTRLKQQFQALAETITTQCSELGEGSNFGVENWPITLKLLGQIQTIGPNP